MKKTMLAMLLASVAVLAGVALAGEQQPVISDLNPLTEFTDISIYTSGNYVDADGVDGWGGTVGLAYEIIDSVSISAEYRYLDVDSELDGEAHQFNLLGSYKMDLGGINPYVFSGPGYLHDETGDYGLISAGVGLELELTDGIAMFVDYRYEWVFDRFDQNTAGVGISVKF